MNRKRVFYGSMTAHAAVLVLLSIGASLQGCSLLKPDEEMTMVALLGTDDPALGTLDGGQPEPAAPPPAPPEPEVATPDPEPPAPDPEAIRIPEDKPVVVKPPDPPKPPKPPEIKKGQMVTRKVDKAPPVKPPVKPVVDTSRFVTADQLKSTVRNPNPRTPGTFGSNDGREGGNGPHGNGGTELGLGQYIRESMYAAWDQPKSVPGGTSARIAGTLHRDGRLTNVRMNSPSGDPAFDASVLTAARRVTRVDFPGSMMKGSSFDFVITYEMKGSPLGSL